DKISSLQHPESYVSGYAGEVGELKAIQALERLGIHAEQFESRVHKANDLVSSGGVEYSVKSYHADRIHEFLNVVHHTPESTHYVVNEELYHRLRDSGELTLLQHDGINVIDG